MAIRSKRSPAGPNDVAFITGAGSGIGRATALALAARGTTVIATDRDLDTARETAALAAAAGGRCEALLLDVTDLANWEAVIEDVCTRHAVPRIVVNNAGYATAGTFFDHSAEVWEQLVAVNVRGVITGSRLFARRMIDAGVRGQIVNIASGAAYAIMPLTSPYCTTKTAVLMFSRVLRMELSHHGIGVTAICPGAVASNFLANARYQGVSPELAATRVAKSVALADMFATSPDRVAAAVLRSIYRNRTVQPVGVESYAGYVLARLSPTGMRVVGRLLQWDTVRLFENTPVVRLLTGIGRKASQ